MVRPVRVSIGAMVAAAAAAVVTGCGANDSTPAARGNAGARTAIERGLLSSMRTAPGVGSVSAVRCAARGNDGRHWTCRLAGDRPQDVAVTVRDDGWWSASGVKAAAAPQMGRAGSSTANFTSGVALVGCCVPRP